MKIEWEDISCYSKTSPKTPSVWQFKFIDMVVLVHRHKDYDKHLWLLTIRHSKDTSQEILESRDIESAKLEAIKKSKQYINVKICGLRDCETVLNVLRIKGENVNG